MASPNVLSAIVRAARPTFRCRAYSPLSRHVPEATEMTQRRMVAYRRATGRGRTAWLLRCMHTCSPTGTSSSQSAKTQMKLQRVRHEVVHHPLPCSGYVELTHPGALCYRDACMFTLCCQSRSLHVGYPKPG